MDTIALRSITSELSNVFVSLGLFQTKYKYLLFVLYAFHIHRYLKYFGKAVEITLVQRDLVLLTVIDYLVIWYHYHHVESRLVTMVLGVLSGVISFYFMYSARQRVELPKASVYTNRMVDMFMLISTSVIIFTSNGNKHVLFFALNHFTYHVLELIVT
ncbi:hypothetical protein SAGO17_0038 [Mimivirus AB-566-O17]|uniref:Uncharacterized protein n=1 Tax=Mimivirus AB-566-O17 TaxID=1988039 RepID=A0A1X9VNR3_9VIRU|nr:hypothetical protein SAGO17_0038 [Mimivirus AB-566-O17]